MQARTPRPVFSGIADERPVCRHDGDHDPSAVPMKRFALSRHYSGQGERMATDKTRGSKGESGEQQASGELLTSKEVRTGIIQLTTGRKAVQYSVVDGLAIFEGD